MPEQFPSKTPPDDAEPSPPRLHPLGTTLFTTLILVFGVAPALQALFVTPEHSPVVVPAAIRVAERDLAATAAHARSLLEVDPRRASVALTKGIDRAALTYSDLVDFVSEEERLDLLARRAVLEAERGNRTAAEWALSALGDSDSAREFERAFSVAYSAKRVPDSEVSGSPTLPRSGWTRNRLELQLARARDDAKRVQELESEMLLEGQRLFRIQEQIENAGYAVVPFGLLALLFWWKSGFRQMRVGAGIGEPPWSGREGLGTIARSVIFGLGMAGILDGLDARWERTTVLSWNSLWLVVPMLFMTWRYLLRPHGIRLIPTFGLSLTPLPGGGWRPLRLLAVVSLLLTAELLGRLAIFWATNALGFESRWNDELLPSFVLGSNWTAAMVSIDAILWAPIGVELAFRGVLYLSLRTRFQPNRAALYSAILFGLSHWYSLPAFLEVVWVGYLWAHAYEYTRSLIPGILCHAVGNLSALALLATYR